MEIMNQLELQTLIKDQCLFSLNYFQIVLFSTIFALI